MDLVFAICNINAMGSLDIGFRMFDFGFYFMSSSDSERSVHIHDKLPKFKSEINSLWKRQQI